MKVPKTPSRYDRALLEIGPPPSEDQRRLDKHFDLLFQASWFGRGIDPNFFESDPTWRGYRAHLEFERLSANPFNKDSNEFDQWAGGWTYSEAVVEAPDYPWSVDLVLEQHVHYILLEACKSPRSQGLAALLRGEPRISNPFAPADPAHFTWDSGWLKGCWLKGYFAASLGETFEFSEQVVRASQDVEALPLALESEELRSWQAGWGAADRLRTYDIAYGDALSGRCDKNPLDRGSENWSAWTEGALAGARAKELGAARELGRKARALGQTCYDNPYPDSSAKSSAWRIGWDTPPFPQIDEDIYGM